MKLARHLLVYLSIIPATYAMSDGTNYPLILTNCGMEVRFLSAPDSAVSVGQSATETLYALGLADRVSGTSVWFTPVLPEFREIDAGIERLADNEPSFESLVNRRPELVAAQYEWHIGPAGSVATREQFHELGIASYVMPADCDTKDNNTGGDGTRITAFSPTAVYKGITELASIFDVQETGQALVAELKTRETNAITAARRLELPEELSAVFWFSSPEHSAAPFVAGRLGAPGYIMESLGIRNVVESAEEWPTVSWESIARSDPDIIVMAKMNRRRYPADDIAEKLDFLHTDPVTREMSAVRSGRIIEMDAHAMSASLRTITRPSTMSTWDIWRSASGIRSPAANASACILPAPWPNNRGFCCSTSPPTIWISATSYRSCNWSHGSRSRW